MSGVAGRVWTWIDPRNLYRPEDGEPGRWRLAGLATWAWRGWRDPGARKEPEDEFWEAREDASGPAEGAGTWWSRAWWNRAWWSPALGVGPREAGEPRDGEASDYGTPPPSPAPTPPPALSLFARSWPGEVLPEHFEICFNLVRHLFDLLVVGLLRAAATPARFVLEALGVRGALKLWLHGMAMFLVSSVGMAGLLWLVWECLPQIALAYGVVQALVISVSVRQSVILGGEEERGGDGEEEEEGAPDLRDHVDEEEDEWEWDQHSGVVKKTEPRS